MTLAALLAWSVYKDEMGREGREFPGLPGTKKFGRAKSCNFSFSFETLSLLWNFGEVPTAVASTTLQQAHLKRLLTKGAADPRKSAFPKQFLELL